MIAYDAKEMIYISIKHPVMKTLVEQYTKLKIDKFKDVYMSLAN